MLILGRIHEYTVYAPMFKGKVSGPFEGTLQEQSSSSISRPRSPPGPLAEARGGGPEQQWRSTEVAISHAQPPRR